MLSMESRSKGKQLMSRYRKTMRQRVLIQAWKKKNMVMRNKISNMHIAILKKEYAPFKR